MEPKKKTSKEEEEERLHQFRNDFRNSSKFSNIIDTLIEYADDEVFSDILNLKESQYLDSINSYLKNKLTEIYTKSIFDNNSLNNLISNKIDKVKKNYNSNFKLLNDAYEFFNNLPKKNLTDYYLTDFRKHCYDTQENCLHSCHSRIKNNLLVVKENKKYLICISCKKVYLNTFIDGYCNSCSVEYKTSILNKNENKMLLPATWKKYHCEEIINEKIKCIKCTKLLYLNFKTQNLDCLNCEFSAKPNRILWTCNIDKVEFKSDAIVYNPLQVEIVKKAINLTLMTKHKAHPNNLSCCPKINVYFQDFFHKKECKGILYLGELRNKLIIVCEKCKSINFYERFIWTCPNCGRRFRDRKSNFRTYKDLVNNDRLNTIEEDNNNDKEEEDKKEKSYRDRLRERRERIHNRINEEDDNKLNKSTTIPEGRHVRRSFMNVNKSVDQLYGKDDEDDSKNKTKNRYNRLYHHQTQEIDENDSKIKSHISGRYKNSYRAVNTEIDDEEEEDKKYPSSTRNKRFSYFFLEKEKENKRKKELEEKEKEKEREEKEREKEREEREKEREKRREQREKERKEREEKEEKEREEREKEREKRRLEREREREKERKERERLNNKNTTDDKTHINYQKRYKLKEKEEQEEQNNKEKERQLRREKIEKERQEQKEKEEKLRIEREQREKARRERIEKRKEESNNENDTKSNRHFYHRHTTGDREHNSNDNNKKNEINDNQKDKVNKKYNKNHSTQAQIEDDSESKTRANTHSPHGGNSLPKEIIKILNEGIIPQINIDDYTILSQVGEGSYGVIYKVKNNHNRKIFALKKEIAHDEYEVKLVYEDVKLINSCNHNNVMKIYGVTVCPLDVTTFAIYILMEYADDDWDKEIKKNYQNRINYKEDELINILKQLASAFRFLQEEKKIAHRDIKPNNILIFNTRGVKEYKIADFGEAKKAKTSKQMNTLRGTELYMSPALYQGLKQDKDDVVYDPYRSDVFSLGYCFLYAGALNIKIILEVRDVDDMGKLEKILRRYFKNKYTERFIQLMLFMLEFDESKRVDFIGLDNYLNENFK